jgi:hypothetical protein
MKDIEGIWKWKEIGINWLVDDDKALKNPERRR